MLILENGNLDEHCLNEIRLVLIGASEVASTHLKAVPPDGLLKFNDLHLLQLLKAILKAN